MKYTYKYFSIIVVTILISACKNEVPEANSDANELEASLISIDQTQFSSSKFKLGKLEKQWFSKTLNTTGFLHIPERSTATVSTLLSGTIGTINLIEGQWINKGESLFTVTNPELINLQEEYLVASGELDYLREEYQHQLDLSKDNLSTKRDLLRAKSKLTATEARHGSLIKKLSLYGINTDDLTTNSLVSSLEVVAPISGYVSDISIRQGMYIDPNLSALTISNTSQIYLGLSVLERDALLLQKGQELTFTLQSDPTNIYTATVHLIHNLIKDNGIVTVYCNIKEETKKLVPGMYANASIILEKYQAYALPEEALVKIDERYFALALKNKNDASMFFEKIEMTPGRIQEGYVEIIKPNDPNLEFMTKGGYYVL